LTFFHSCSAFIQFIKFCLHFCRQQHYWLLLAFFAVRNVIYMWLASFMMGRPAYVHSRAPGGRIAAERQQPGRRAYRRQADSAAHPVQDLLKCV
jgi:hypothetical protein